MKLAASNSGFSLVEVLVAILILGVAVVGLTQGITVALQSSKESEQQATAALFAAGQVETLRAEGGLLDGEQDGDCGEGLSLYRWKQSITAAGLAGLHEVAVVVENAKSGKPIYELRTLLFEPTDAPTPDSSQNRKKSDSRDRRSR
jgi:general secretion pathway protein I